MTTSLLQITRSSREATRRQASSPAVEMRRGVRESGEGQEQPTPTQVTVLVMFSHAACFYRNAHSGSWLLFD